jgi:hypothetical protein
MSMKNFNIYDPMKKGQGLTLDGQTLAHLEVTIFFLFDHIYVSDMWARSSLTMKERKKALF